MTTTIWEARERLEKLITADGTFYVSSARGTDTDLVIVDRATLVEFRVRLGEHESSGGGGTCAKQLWSRPWYASER